MKSLTRDLATSFNQLACAFLIAVLVSGCGGDFEYKTSGDRVLGKDRGRGAGGGGGSTASHEQLLTIQEQYQAKAEAAKRAKS
jgi:hypothetical protein